ncbi:MAG: hypothetical protein FJ385_02145 [Verrucomicrobia bacterium]|jgi:hypothetical protein|nr:hypothetical protein [Verrucomicrobiota bacterium]
MVSASGHWRRSKDLARAILADRTERRLWMFRVALVPLLMLAAGLWWIDGWLMQSAVRFLAWWGFCGLGTLVLLMFAIFDALCVIREERGRRP